MMEAKYQAAESEIAAVAGAASLGPKTPVRENGYLSVDSGSPLTAEKKFSPIAASFDSNTRKYQEPSAEADAGSPETPKDKLFNPFAPACDDMALAPICNKYTNRFRIITSPRPLDFDSPTNLEKDASQRHSPDSISDQVVLEFLSESLFEFILWSQIDASDRDWGSGDSRTPHSAPRLNGIADTCPGAPRKPSGKSRDIDLELCRKLF